MDDINKQLEGQIIVKAEVTGYGIELTLSNGSVFTYSASDGGYSSWDINPEN